MSQVVSAQTYCLENSTHLTRPGTDAFYHIDGSNDPTVIDKNQVKRLYRLQRTPYVNARLHLDTSDVGYEKQGHFESILKKQINESTIQRTTSLYHRPTDMSDLSMARFSLGKARLDPQRIVPSETTTVRNHPSAFPAIRHDQNSTPRYSDRSVLDGTVRAKLGPGGSFNLGEDCEVARNYFRSSQPNLRNYSKKQQLQQSMTDELARHYMYTSAQQAAFDEVQWDSKLPSKIPAPTTTYEANGSDPVFKSNSLSSFYDVRTHDVLEWDRVQPRNSYYHRKPFDNVAPLPRAQQISGYSGSIGGNNILDIDNPRIDFKPYTIVRTEQPKFTIDSFKANIPSYTGKTHWTKLDPVSHRDQEGHAYTTTAAFHKSLPIDSSDYRHTGLHGQLSRAVTTVMPQNPFNQIDNISTTINTSLDSRPHILIRQLPSKSFSSPRASEQIIPE